MKIEIKEVLTKKDLQTFIELPMKLHSDLKNYIPPLQLSQYDIFNKNHPFYKNAVQKSWIAYLDGTPQGRITAIINHVYIDFHKSKTGHFGFFECTNNQGIANLLFKVAEDYLKLNGMEKMEGPFSPSTNYECGVLIDGFDDDPQIMMTYNPKYYDDLIKNVGLEKIKDLNAYSAPSNINLPEKVFQIASQAEKSFEISYRHIDLKNWDKEIELIFDIYNSAWENNWGFVPMSKEEFFHSAKSMKSIVDKKLIIFAEVKKQPVGFIMTLPDYNQVFKKIKDGKLFPTGIFKVLFGRKNITRARVITLGIRKEYRKLGLANLLYKQSYLELKNSQYKDIEMSWVLEDNEAMNGPIIGMGGKLYKRYRIYAKSIQ